MSTIGVNGTAMVVTVSQTGSQGPRGYSTYQIAVLHGYEGTEAEWLNEQEQSRLAAQASAIAAAASADQAAAVVVEVEGLRDDTAGLKADAAIEADRSTAQADRSELAANMAVAAADTLYASTALGIANTIDGEFFLVEGTPGGTVYAILYKNVAGVAVDQELEIPSKAALDELIGIFPLIGDMAFAFNDPNGVLYGGFRKDGPLVARNAAGDLIVSGTKQFAGLSNVDDTSDEDKPLSAATRAALDEVQAEWPLFADLLTATVDQDRILASGTRKDGQMVARDESGALVALGSGGGSSAEPTTFDYNLNDTTGVALIRPNDGRLRVYGSLSQSFGIGTIDSALYASRSPYNSTAFDAVNALMPSVGLLVDTAFTTFTGLREQKNGNGATVETHATEWVKGVMEAWDGAGLSRTPVAMWMGGKGGTPIQGLMVGSPPFVAWMTKLRRMVTAARLAGFPGVVVDAFTYIQGEDNRSDPYRSDRLSWARALSTLQQQVEYYVRQITGQVETVPMLVAPIARSSLPAEINYGAVLAAETNPGRIILLNPNYALEYPEDQTAGHGDVAGYRRMGRYAAMATLGAVYGHDYRAMLPRRWWFQDSTHLRIEVCVPKGASLVKDTSGDLIYTTGLGNGAGFRAWDTTGELTINSALIASSNHPASNAAYGGTIELTFNSAPDQSSLVVNYATRAPAGSGDGQGGLGGRAGPRGLFRADDGLSIADLTLPVHSWLQPFEIGA